MKPEDLQQLAAALRRSRAARLDVMTDTNADLRELAADRESELEEAAQEDKVARILTQLDDRSRRALDEIDRALERMVQGSYGLCVECEEEIPLARLQALPTATRCVECASKAEANRAAVAATEPAGWAPTEPQED